MNIGEEKQALRAAMLARRDGLSAEHRATASAAIGAAVIRLSEQFPVGPVSIFWPIRSEVDTRPLLEQLAERGFATCLPVVAGESLIFRAWSPGTPLRKAGFGLYEPPVDAPQLRPSTLLVPLCAFDRRAHRLGYGKGYYDRTLAELSRRGPIFSVGLAFSAQEAPLIPVEAHDQALHVIVTESATIAGRAGPSVASA